MVQLVHQLITDSAARHGQRVALRYQDLSLTYLELAHQTGIFSAALLALGLQRYDRVAVFLEKRIETVVALFGTSMAGATFVPLNPLLKPEQVVYQLNDCQVRVLVTSAPRFESLQSALRQCPALRVVILVGADSALTGDGQVQVMGWDAIHGVPAMHCGASGHRCIDQDLAAILYTSGSTGKPKGVMLSHRNLVSGAQCVAGYLNNCQEDRVLCVLPLSFDYGLSQLTSVFLTGGTAVLLNYLMPIDILDTIRHERITGLAAIPPLWGQLAQLDWSGVASLRYLTNSGGAMPAPVLAALRNSLPNTLIYLMYGLTEAFRSTYLDPEQLERRPDSIGKAVPDNEVLVLRADGSVCAADEPGELVHRGSLVALGYWNAPELTARRFRALPLPFGTERAVWSGDMVKTDRDGYLYYVGRSDEMIKVSGYRISPTEVEEVLFRLDGILELAVTGVEHPLLGQAIVAAIQKKQNVALSRVELKRHCALYLPSYMVPLHFEIDVAALPRNANGKIDRPALRLRFAHLFTTSAQPEQRRP